MLEVAAILGLGVLLGWGLLAIAWATHDLRWWMQHHRQQRRRRAETELHGTDALEAWLPDIDWQRHQPSNGTPFEGDEVA